MNGPEVLNKYIGQSEESIRALFDDAILDDKIHGLRSGLHVIVFDEIDSIASTRGGTEENKTYDKIVNQLLSMIDGVKEVSNVFIIGTTNRKEILDEALLRPGRLELHIEVKYPDEQGLAKILEIYTKKFRDVSLIDDDVDLQEIAHRAHGGSGATMASVVSYAFSYAIEKFSLTSSFINLADMNFKMSMDDFIHGLETAMPRLNQTSTEEVPSSSTGMAEIQRALTEHGKLKNELSFYKEEKNKLEKTVDVLGAIVNYLKVSEVEMVRGSASGFINTQIQALTFSEHGKLKNELSFYKEEKNKLEKAVDVLGAIVNNLKVSEVEMVRGSAIGLINTQIHALTFSGN